MHKQNLMDKFTTKDHEGNKLKPRQIEIETWMKLLRLSHDEIEYLRSQLDVVIDEKGARISTSINPNSLQVLFQKSTNHIKPNDTKQDADVSKIQPLAKLFTEKPYANLGHCLHVADINGDGTDDLLIGAPGGQ